MKCCINPQCPNPDNLDGTVYCQACGVLIPDLLRRRFRMIKLLGQGGFGRTYPVNSVAFSPDGWTLASGSGKTIKLWQAR